MLETYEWKNCPIPCTDKLGQMPISYILKTCTVFLLNVLKNFVLKSHLKAPNMQQLKKKRERKQMKVIYTTTLKSATYFEWGLDGLLWH